MSKRDSSEKEEKSGLDPVLGPVLDLGLASLLSTKTDEVPVPPSPQREEAPKEILPSEELSPLGALAAQSNWDELLKVSEYQLTVSQSTEARAWWVYAHLMRKSMPAAFLAAPFENLLLGSLSGITDHDRALLSKVGSLLVERLSAADEKGLAAVIQEKLLSQKLPCTSSPTTSNSSTSTSQLNSAQKENEAAHLAALSGLQHLVTHATIEVAPNVKEPRGRSLPNDSKSSRRPRKLFALGGACAAFIALGFVIFYRVELENLTSLPVSVASEEFYSTPKQVELLNPELKRRDVVGSLTALFYSIDKTPTAGGDAVQSASTSQPVDGALLQKGAPQPGPNPPPPPMLSVPVGQDPAAASSVPSEPSQQPTTLQPSAPTGVERVKTDGPIEPQSVRERIQGRRELPRLPTIDRAPREPEKDSRGGVKDKNSPFGKKPREDIVMGIPEPDVNDGIRYQVMTRTTVLSEPHYSATTVGRLLPGDIIIVERRIGEWLKLRSIKGRPGYVLAQDVAGAPYEEYRR